MTHAERAAACFEEGFSCSQSVLSAYAEEFGLPRDVALKLAEAFGGGMKMGKTCGAVTGALMAIGLKHGRLEAGDEGAKEKTKQLAQAFVEEFRSRHGTVECRELLGCDVNMPEGLEYARENGYFTTLCPRFVRDAAEIVEQML